MTLAEKIRLLKQKAKERGLKVLVDKRLNKTEYRAAHPNSSKYVGDRIVCKKNAITVAPFVAKKKKLYAMDVNHELLEFDASKKGYGYKRAHTLANRKQRNFTWLEK